MNEWLSDFETTFLGSKNITITDLTSSEYYSYLKMFINDSDNERWKAEIIFDNDLLPTKIEYTRFYMFGAMTASIIKQWPIKKKYNKVFDEYFDSNQGFIWDDTWPNSHLDKSVTKFTVLNIITATIAVFCVQIEIKFPFPF